VEEYIAHEPYLACEWHLMGKTEKSEEGQLRKCAPECWRRKQDVQDIRYDNATIYVTTSRRDPMLGGNM